MNRLQLKTCRCLALSGMLFLGLLPAACQQQMAQQPSYRPLDSSDFFPDGGSARPLQPGTIARGQLHDESAFFTGRASRIDGAKLATALVGWPFQGTFQVGLAAPPILREMALADYASTFPVPVSTELLERGRERYGIFCAVCHDPAGTGHGKIVERGFTRPPSYITDRSRGFERRGIDVLLLDAPVGYYFEVISKGYGAMPDHAVQVAPPDRWAIIAYIRALQLSQHARLDKMPEKERQVVREALEKSK